MTDPGARRHDIKIVKTFLSPFEQRISLRISFVFFGDIFGQGIRSAEIIHLYGVIDDQIHRHQRIYFCRIPTKILNCVTHGRQVHDCRYTGKILHQYAGRMIRYLSGCIIALFPFGNIEQIFLPDDPAIQFAQKIFNQNFDRKRQPADRCNPFFFQFIDIKYLIFNSPNTDMVDEFGIFHAYSFCFKTR